MMHPLNVLIQSMTLSNSNNNNNRMKHIMDIYCMLRGWIKGFTMLYKAYSMANSNVWYVHTALINCAVCSYSTVEILNMMEIP